MMDKSLHFNWTWQLASAPEELWPLVSDTNRLNRALKLPALRESHLSNEYKNGFAQLSYNPLHLPDAWEEEPYEWERPFRYGVRRTYKNGSLEKLRLQVDLTPNPSGTRLRYQLWIQPKNIFGYLFHPVAYQLIFRSRLKRFLHRADSQVSKNLHPYELEKPKTLVKGARQRIRDIEKQVSATGIDTRVFDRLVDYILRADDNSLEKIKPYELADHWNIDRNSVLQCFLHAARRGLLNFNWDLYCPDCRTVQHTCRTLAEIHEPIFCKDCNREFYVNFNRTVQVSFQPHPLIRKISIDKYCLTGPQAKPHVVMQQHLKAGQKRYLNLHLDPGEYYLRMAGKKGRIRMTVTGDGHDTITISSRGLMSSQWEVAIAPEPNLVIHNTSRSDKIFTLEKANWQANSTSAAQITSLQTFRDLFDKEVIRKGERLVVNDMTLMFTDLLGSTHIYNREGDSTAVGHLIEHFDIIQQAVAEHEGAIIKTIGDSVMAVFSEPLNALKAFLKARHAISRDPRFNRMLKLKAGIHYGNCVAVNLNNRIDYFGTTVNIASRLVDLSNENEVVISESASRMAGLDRVLTHSPVDYYSSETVRTALKGFGSKKFNVRRISVGRPELLRMAI